VSWTPNNNADTVGYDVFIDSPPGSRPIVSDAAPAAQQTIYNCPDSSTSGSSSGSGGTGDATVSDAVSTDGAPTDAASAGDVASDAPSGAEAAANSGGQTTDACSNVNGGGSLGTTSCASAALGASPILASGTVQDSGVADDAAQGSDSAVSSSQGGGGISTILCQYLSSASCSAGAPAYTNNGSPSVTGIAISSQMITNLTNGATYNVAVAAVDASGNVGPQSSVVCDMPAPVNDFYKIYRMDGGRAGGGFCALEAVGAPGGAPIVSLGIGGAALALARRRKRDRR
jgi:hypothetical protein